MLFVRVVKVTTNQKLWGSLIRMVLTSCALLMSGPTLSKLEAVQAAEEYRILNIELHGLSKMASDVGGEIQICPFNLEMTK